jgi:hypothetical protein
MPKTGHFSPCVSFLEHKWADSETISLGLRNYRSGGKLFFHKQRLRASKFGVGGGRQAFAFCQASAAYSIAPKIEPAVQYE